MAEPALASGSVIAGRYVVEALLGRGGMGAVYRVYDRVLDERVALKLLAMVENEKRELERFYREARLARRITHKSVARTFDVGEENAVHFLTMELVSGESIRQRLRARGRFPRDEALAIAAQVCDGLGAAHDEGIVHRDLKPSNVLVRPDGRAVIVDFGIARALADDQSITQGVIGTPAYMSPEQLGGRSADERSDLYALGLILHEMLTGVLPSWGGQRGDVLLRITSETPPTLEIEPATPIATLILGLLELEPARRPDSARRVAARIRELASSGEATELTTPIIPKRPSSSPPTRSRDFAPLPGAGRTLAVLPFSERGQLDPDFGDNIAEELVDTLTRLSGIRVLAMGKQAGADFVVDGSVQRRGDGIRVTARLVEVSGGLQLWSERFEGGMEDVASFQEEMGQRIAEALRIELAIVTDRGSMPREAVELYRVARKKLRSLLLFGEDGAPMLLERVVALAPTFRPALAELACAATSRAFVAGVEDQVDYRHKAEEIVARALAEAPDLPETQLAAGMLEAHVGNYAGAARHIRTAVTIAPTFSSGQEYLGHLQCEAGRAVEGVKRLKQALLLDPNLRLAPLDLARHYLLQRNHDEYQRYLAELERRTEGRGVGIAQLLIRAAAWSRDFDALNLGRQRFYDEHIYSGRFISAYCDYLTKPSVDENDANALALLPDKLLTPRLKTFGHQVMAEAFGLRGQEAHCVEQLELAAASALVDLEWLELCPALDLVRELPRYHEVFGRVQNRTIAIWGA